MENPSDRHRSRVGRLRKELHTCLNEALVMASKCHTDQDKALLLDELLKRMKEIIADAQANQKGTRK